MRRRTTLITAVGLGGLAAAASAIVAVAGAHADEAKTTGKDNGAEVAQLRVLSTGLAQQAAQAAFETCTDQGNRVTVSVVGRDEGLLALVRNEQAGPASIDSATGKAYASAGFRAPTGNLGDAAKTNPACCRCRGSSCCAAVCRRAPRARSSARSASAAPRVATSTKAAPKPASTASRASSRPLALGRSGASEHVERPNVVHRGACDERARPTRRRLLPGCPDRWDRRCPQALAGRERRARAAKVQHNADAEPVAQPVTQERKVAQPARALATLGHASAVMALDRYGHPMPSAASAVADRLDEMARAAVPARSAAASEIGVWPPRGLGRARSGHSTPPHRL